MAVADSCWLWAASSLATLLLGCADDPMFMPLPPLADTARGQQVSVRAGQCDNDSAGCVVATATRCDITLDMAQLSSEPPMFAWWVLGHEMGHCTLMTNDEIEADCYGIEWVVGMGFQIDGGTIASVADTLRCWPPDETHPSGWRRAQSIRACAP